MAGMDDLKKKNDADLATTLRDARETLRSSRFSVAGGKARNTKEARETKKTIARILTEQRIRSKNE